MYRQCTRPDGISQGSVAHSPPFSRVSSMRRLVSILLHAIADALIRLPARLIVWAVELED